MSNTVFIVIAVVVAIGLDWWLVRWWKRHHQLKPVAAAQTEPSGEPSLIKSPRSLSNLLSTGSSRTALLALSLGLLAQFWLTSGTSLLGGIIYAIAIFLFVRSVRVLVPSKFDQSRLSVPESKPKTLTQPATFISFVKSIAQPKITPSVQSPGFWRHWRYYTVGNLINGTPPNIPATALVSPTPPEQTSSEVQTSPIPINILGEMIIETPVEMSTQPVSSLTITPQPPASVSSPIDASIEVVKQIPTLVTPSPTIPPTPIGAHHSRVMAVAPSGEIVVIDSTKQLLFVFGPQGQLHKKQPFEILPNLTADDITFSPDGTTAYIFDSATQSLKVISLL